MNQVSDGEDGSEDVVNLIVQVQTTIWFMIKMDNSLEKEVNFCLITLWSVIMNQHANLYLKLTDIGAILKNSLWWNISQLHLILIREKCGQYT